MSRLALGLVMAAFALASRSAVAAPIEDYGKLPAVEQMELSPSGDKIAYVAVAGDRRAVVVTKVGGAAIVALNVGELKARGLGWMGDGHLLIETSKTLGDVNRYEAVQSTIVDASTGKLTNVFESAGRILHATFGYYGYLIEGAKAYGYFGGVTLTGTGNAAQDFDNHGGFLTQGHSDLYKVDLDTGIAAVAAGGLEHYDTQWVVDPAGAVAAYAQYDERKGYWRLYAGGGTGLISEGEDPTRDISLDGLGRAPGTVLVNQPARGEGGDFTVFEYQARLGAKGAPIFADEEAKWLLRDPVSRLLIGGVTNSDDPKTRLFDPALQAKFDKVRPALSGETVTLVSATANLDRMILYAEGPGDSGTYFFVDYPTRKIEAVGWAYPTILQGAVGTTQILDYKAADGLEMQGILTLPPGREAKALPLIVMPHGGPQARDYQGFDWWAQAYASRGYAVFQPNFRGSDGFGKTFRDAGFGQWGRKMQTDISDGVAELARRGLVDPKRACIVGASYGGYAALAGVTVQHGLYRCAVSVGGVADLNAMLTWQASRAGEVSATMRYWHRFMGVTGNHDSALDAYSPHQLVNKADAPILLIFGRDDSVVSINQSRDMAVSLRGAGKPVEVLQLAGEDHWLSRGATRVQMLQASVAFVEKHNPPDGAAK